MDRLADGSDHLFLDQIFVSHFASNLVFKDPLRDRSFLIVWEVGLQRGHYGRLRSLLSPDISENGRKITPQNCCKMEVDLKEQYAGSGVEG